jgi:hypothetical protein
MLLQARPINPAGLGRADLAWLRSEVAMTPLIVLVAVLSAVPNYDIDKICKSATSLGDSQSPIAGCLQDEKAAKDRVVKAWPTYPASARQECTSNLQFDIGRSYVELETCFQMQDWKNHIEDIGGTHVPGAHGPQLR